MGILKTALEPRIQDVTQAVHIDVSVLRLGGLKPGGPTNSGPSLQHRYIKRLHRRADLPELYERLLWFPDCDSDCIVEMFLRFPRTQTHQFSPLKIGEWRLVR